MDIWAQAGSWESLPSFQHDGDTVGFVFSSNVLFLRDCGHVTVTDRFPAPRGDARLSYICHCIFAESDSLS